MGNIISKKTLIGIVLLLATITIYFVYFNSGNNNNNQNIVNVSGSYILDENLLELTERADLIVVGTPTTDFNNRKHVVTKYQDGAIQDFYTLTDFKINKIIKSPTDFDQKNKSIEFIEPITSITGVDGKQQILTVEEYSEVKEGKKYIVFLQKNTSGQYGVINMNFGKFNLDGKDFKDLNLDNNEEKQLKLKLMDEIKGKHKTIFE